MGKLYSLISALLLTVSATFAASPDSYEWWFDQDVSSAQTGSLSGSAIDLQIDTSDLPKGIHYFNLRLLEGEVPGTVYRRMFHSFGQDSGAISYEYWFDTDYDARQTGSLNVGSNHLNLDISSLPQGAHYFNIRLGYGDGSWGAVYRKMVLNLAGNVNAIAYEYWIDNNYNAKTEGSVAPGSNTYTVDLQGVRRGLHRFNYRLMTGEGVWGAPFTSYFYSESNPNRFTDYEYWLDNDYANRVTGNASGNPTTFEVDLSSFDKSGGAHYFNLRTRDGDGDWSPIYRKLLVFNKTEKRQPIIGYRHYLDGTDLGYVEVERQFVDSYMFDINLPDSLYPSVKNRRPTFDGDRVFLAGADSIEYTMHVRTEFGWAAPQKWKLGIGNDFSTTAVAMQINSMHTFAAPTDLGFAAMKFTATGDSLYFRSDIPVALDIYKSGEKVSALTAAQVKGMAMLRLEAGEYFGVLHSVEDAEAQNFTLHLMDTPNQVPVPHISYENETVNITCTRQDATIRYTLDGKDPDGESTLFNDPFPMKRNGTIKAKAWVEGSDIEPSAVAEYMIDTYKVATPRGSFDIATRLLTLTCDTVGATIFYNFDREGEWTAYSATERIRMRKNGTVYAKATFDGYNDSDVAEIVVSELPDAVVQPEILCDGNIVNGSAVVVIRCATDGAAIRYTFDDVEPTMESTLYEREFSITRNTRVNAFAYVPDLDIEPSMVSSEFFDIFRVEGLRYSFDPDTRELKIECDTEGATILYTSDPNGEWTEYSASIQIRKNCTLYAKAVRDGYHDSETLTITINSLADSVPVPVISFENNMVDITCANTDAEIHYTIDNPDLTAESPLYTGPFELNRNATIRAFALIPGLDIEPSDIVTKVIDSFKVAAPTGSFNAERRELTLSCATGDAKIFYSFAAEGEWTEYTGPISITRNRNVYAKATREGWNDSDVATIPVTELADNVPSPEISFANGKVGITCANANAEIHYTIDNPNLTAESPLYTGPFDLDRNATIRAFALIPGLDIEPSDIVTKVIDSFKVEAPTGSFDPESRTLTLTCATEDARISYTFDQEGDWTPYSTPISITRNTTVYAKATREGWNDSDVATIPVTELADNVPSPEISFANGKVEITCANANAEIHYTIDDPNLTAESPLYTGPFDLDRNATIRAFALVPGLDIEPSDIVTKVIDSFKVEAPTGSFDPESRTLTLTCATEDARISYTFDQEGEWTPYSTPISITRNTTVYAKASREGWNDSDVAPIPVTELADNVPAPVISFADGMVEITCANANAEIHYTIDDENLTAESTVYTDPFPLDRNATIRAFALIPGLDIEPSAQATYTVDSYKVATPYGQFDSASRTLTILCDTEEASIFYTLDEDGEWLPYSEPFVVEGNLTVYAMATFDGWNDSDVAEIVISDVKCADVAFSPYNGRYVSITTEEEGAVIRYSTDGSEPSGGRIYTEAFDPEGLCTVRAVAVKEGFMNSDIAELVISYYADEEHAETSAEGLLASAFEWDDTNLPGSIEDFRVEGRLNEADYEFIRSMAALRHLDLEKVADAHIPANAFRDSRLISISLPEDLAECGDSILSGASNLSSVVWNSRTVNVGDGITQGLVNPNMLLYLPVETGVTGRTDLNIVREGSEPEVTLHYGYPYYAARGFRAARVSLTHEFTQTTKVDTCRGWETIVLPFSPTEIRHEENGPIVPFSAWNEDINGDKPFWLHYATSSGWEAADSMEAGVPYIISMPNNPDYVREFILGGKVTFSAENVDLGPEGSLPEGDDWIDGTRFTGTFMPVEETTALSLNVNSTEGGFQPGSTFIPGSSTPPFGAYVSGADGRRAMPLFGGSSTIGVAMIVDAGLLIESPAPGVLKVCSGRECRVAVTTATGVTIRTLHLKPGEAQTLEGLTRDLYIVAGRKVMVR